MKTPIMTYIIYLIFGYVAYKFGEYKITVFIAIGLMFYNIIYLLQDILDELKKRNNESKGN